MDRDDSLSIGDEAVDAQHHELLEIFGRIESAIECQMDHGQVGAILEHLGAYIGGRFAAEERLMLSIGYPDAQSHTHEHARLAQKTRDLTVAHKLGVESAVPLTLLLRDWVFEHIRRSDQLLAEYARGFESGN